MPSFSTCAEAAGSRPASVWLELENEFHQPEAMIWSLSRSDETRMPSVGMVQIATKIKHGDVDAEAAGKGLSGRDGHLNVLPSLCSPGGCSRP